MTMNRNVLESLGRGDLFPVTVSPCAGLIAEDGAIRSWNITVIRKVLAHGHIPLTHGDAVLDRRRGFTIVSTEDLFLYLAPQLKPTRVVLACDVEGVYLYQTSTPSRKRVVRVVDRSNITRVRRALREAARGRRGPAWDVTGGMAAKVERLYELVRRMPGLEVRIVTGLKSGVVESALLGDNVGTVIRYP